MSMSMSAGIYICMYGWFGVGWETLTLYYHYPQGVETHAKEGERDA